MSNSQAWAGPHSLTGLSGNPSCFLPTSGALQAALGIPCLTAALPHSLPGSHGASRIEKNGHASLQLFGF